MKYKAGDRVRIVMCPIMPEVVGEIGVVRKVRLLSNGMSLYKVAYKGKMIPDYALTDCLEKVED